MDVRQELQRFISDPASRRDPRATYDRLLREARVLAVDESERVFYVSGYPEIVTLATNPAAVTDFARVGIDVGRGLNYADLVTKMLPMRSGPDHARLRRLATSAFSARTVESLRPAVERAVEELLEPHLECGEIDVVTDLARPLPVAVSCAMLDIPIQDRAQVGQWAATFTRSLWPGALPPQAADLADFFLYIDDLCAHRRRHPGRDLISVLVDVHAHGALDDDELVAFVLMLFVNGLDTLTSGLSAAVWHAIERPQVLRQLRGNTARGEAVFDECQRLAGPVRASGRVLLADVEVDGRLLPARSAVVLLFAAANRDPDYFPHPDELITNRPRRHLAFGFGFHYCLGAPISLAAGSAVLRFIAQRLDGAATSITRDSDAWDTSLPFAGLHTLPMTFTPARSSHPVAV